MARLARIIHLDRSEQTIAANAPCPEKTPLGISDLGCPADSSAAWSDYYRLRAVARPWRAGAGTRDFLRRTNRCYRKLRFHRDPLVAGAQCGRAGAPFPCRRRQRRRAAERWTRGDRRRRWAHRDLDTRQRRARRRAGRSYRPDRGAGGIARRENIGVRVVGSNGAAVAARRWRG